MWDAAELRRLFEHASFAKVVTVAESTMVRFAELQRFVALAVTSPAAAVPAFAQMDTPARAALLEEVRAEVEPIVGKYRHADAVAFLIYAHVAVGIA